MRDMDNVEKFLFGCLLTIVGMMMLLFGVMMFQIIKFTFFA